MSGDDEARQRLRADLIDRVQRLGLASRHLGDLFAARQGLHPTDLEALLHVMRAEDGGEPLSAGALAEALGVSTGAATGVIDRLEGLGHLRRRRGDRDRRRVTLHHSAEARAVAEEFFGPLAVVSDAVADDFTLEELATIARYLDQVRVAFEDHVRSR